MKQENILDEKNEFSKKFGPKSLILKKKFFFHLTGKLVGQNFSLRRVRRSAFSSLGAGCRKFFFFFKQNFWRLKKSFENGDKTFFI